MISLAETLIVGSCKVSLQTCSASTSIVGGFVYVTVLTVPPLKVMSLMLPSYQNT